MISELLVGSHFAQSESEYLIRNKLILKPSIKENCLTPDQFASC